MAAAPPSGLINLQQPNITGSGLLPPFIRQFRYKYRQFQFSTTKKSLNHTLLRAMIPNSEKSVN
jgi:hypothetical protein